SLNCLLRGRSLSPQPSAAANIPGLPNVNDGDAPDDSRLIFQRVISSERHLYRETAGWLSRFLPAIAGQIPQVRIRTGLWADDESCRRLLRWQQLSNSCNGFLGQSRGDDDRRAVSSNLDKTVCSFVHVGILAAGRGGRNGDVTSEYADGESCSR